MIHWLSALTGLVRLAAHPDLADLQPSDTAAGELTITLDDGRILTLTRRRPAATPAASHGLGPSSRTSSLRPLDYRCRRKVPRPRSRSWSD